MALLNFYVYHGFGHQPDIYRKGSGEKPWVALTFDDGPSPLYTPRILQLLEAYDVPATFFMVGAHVEEYPDIAAAVVAAGHEVGNHTYTHINVPTASTQRLYEELLGTTAVILEKTGAYPEYIRPPAAAFMTVAFVAWPRCWAKRSSCGTVRALIGTVTASALKRSSGVSSIR